MIQHIKTQHGKRWMSAAALGGAVLATAGALNPAWGATTPTPTTGHFALVAHHGSDTNVDLGATGFSVGDEDLMVSPLTFHGRPAGSLVGSCTNVRVTRSAVDQLCQMTLRLAHGQVTASGAVHAGEQGPGTFSLAILGGTGKYAGVGGTLAVTASNGATVPLSVTLTR